MSAPARPPKLHPTTMREALIVATALNEVADTQEARYPLSARILRKRAQRYIEHQAQSRRGAEVAASSGSRWASRVWKSGPLVRPGPAHVTAADPAARTTDPSHLTVCGKRLTGRRIEFGPHAGHPDIELPKDWYPCGDCQTHLRANARPVTAPRAAA